MIVLQSEVAAYCILRGRDGNIKKAADAIIDLAERIKAERARFATQTTEANL